MMPIQELRRLLEGAFPGDRIDLHSDDNHHFQLLIVSPLFAEKSRVEQHQLVYRALGDAMREAVHALALKTFTPEQWERHQGRG
ncbi:MAG: BolA/IbaG family iron-sulfur metabolism protein [Candidatus Lambdaproteobacteria bacterium]|nr:BolA/IbaG family iron-sulfur metabolism protein [Candidatus Lambdaproteobacteria bacterium]